MTRLSVLLLGLGLIVGGVVGSGVTYVLVVAPACPAPDNTTWHKFMNVPPLPTDTGKTYK